MVDVLYYSTSGSLSIVSLCVGSLPVGRTKSVEMVGSVPAFDSIPGYKVWLHLFAIVNVGQCACFAA